LPDIEYPRPRAIATPTLSKQTHSRSDALPEANLSAKTLGEDAIVFAFLGTGVAWRTHEDSPSPTRNGAPELMLSVRTVRAARDSHQRTNRAVKCR